MKKSYDKDITIFNNIKSNNQKALNELFNKYYHVLCEYSFLITNDKAGSEEIVADIFANIWINRDKIYIKKNVRAYLFKSTKNLAISYLRKNKNIFEKIEEENLINTNSNSPDQYIINREKQLKIKDILDIIPKRSREIFILHRFSGLKYQDIAETLDISVKTVEKHISKALRVLRETFQDKSQII